MGTAPTNTARVKLVTNPLFDSSWTLEFNKLPTNQFVCEIGEKSSFRINGVELVWQEPPSMHNIFWIKSCIVPTRHREHLNKQCLETRTTNNNFVNYEGYRWARRYLLRCVKFHLETKQTVQSHRTAWRFWLIVNASQEVFCDCDHLPKKSFSCFNALGSCSTAFHWSCSTIWIRFSKIVSQQVVCLSAPCIGRENSHTFSKMISVEHSVPIERFVIASIDSMTAL